ncbi:MAG: nucleoside phosphorylase [Candidatus Korobacteraceae bacterium]
MPERIVIVAAMQREIYPLVRGWQRVGLKNGRGWGFENLMVVCGGVGAGPAERATEEAVAAFQPKLLVSAGFAGALQAELRVPELVVAGSIVDAVSGETFSTADASARKVLLTTDSIAGPDSKRELALRFGACAVDMEAASVARVARRHGLGFRAIKVISDGVDCALPPFSRFLTADGEFRTRSFAFFLAARPWLWPAIARLGRDSAVAAGVLAETLRPLVQGNRKGGEVASISTP